MDFRPIRRQDRAMEEQQAEQFLKEHNWGILSVFGENGYPYGVPVNYTYRNGKAYFHSTSGQSHKIERIRKNPKVCLTVVGEHQLIEAEFTTQFSSVILFGTAKIIAEDVQKREAAIEMMQGLAPDAEKAAIIDCGLMKTMVMVEITPEHITGKQRK